MGETAPQTNPDIIDHIPSQAELVAQRQLLESADPQDMSHALTPEQIRILRDHEGVPRGAGGVALPEVLGIRIEVPPAFHQKGEKTPQSELRAMREQIAREDAQG